MKKFLKILGFLILVISVILYCSFLFILPKAIDINQYKPDIQKIVKEQSNLDLNYSDSKIITTPFLGIGVKADDIKINLPDKSLLFSSQSIKTTVSLPSLLLLTIKISDFEAQNPFINAEILKNGEDYKIVKLIEDILNTKKEKTFGEKTAAVDETSQFDASLLKIVIPNVKLNNYQIVVTDLATNHYLDLHGDKLLFGYFNGKRIKVKTNAELYSDTNKNITAAININTFLPEPAPKLDTEDDPAEKIDIPFVNPVMTYQNYDLKTNIDAKIRANKNKQGEITSYGYINIDNITMKLSTLQLPESYIKLKTFGSNVNLDTNIYPTKEENINIIGDLNYGVHKRANLDIQTSKIEFSNLLAIARAFLDSLQIPNELNQYKAEGSMSAKCNIKTNFRKLKSNGYMQVANGGLSVRNLGKIISKMNINLVLDDNSLDIRNSGLFIKNSEVKINGLIDKKSYTDINVLLDKLPLTPLFEAFAPADIRKAYNLKNGEVSSSLSVKGKMKEAAAKVDFNLKNLDLSDKNNSFNIKNNNFNTQFVYDVKKQNLTGFLNNKGFKFTIPVTGSVISCPDAEINIADKNIEIEQNVINFNDKSAIIYSGKVVNYENPQSINFVMNGGLNTDDIIKLLGNEFKPFINSKGSIPVNVTYSGNANRQTLFAEALADAANYITPIDFIKLKDLKSVLQATVDFKPSRIKIKNTGFYTRASVYDESGKETKILNKIIGIDGTIEDDNINLLKVDIPKNMDGRIYVFPKSKYVLNSAKVYMYGKTASPLIKGDLRISDISIPEILTSIDKIDLNFREADLNFYLKEIQMLSSDLNIKGKYSLVPDVISNIYDLDITSKYMNVEDITAVSAKAADYAPKTEQNTSSQQTQDIPIAVHSGSIDMKSIVTGNIELFNTKANLTVLKNILALKGLTTDIFKGKVWGDILVNLNSILINTDLKGKNIDVEKALLDSANMKDSLSGTAEFTSKLMIDGAASSPEVQMAGILGDVDFKITDGQFGPFGKLENLILAENIRESQFFQTALGGILESIATIDTTHFSELNGHISLKDGICNINPITSSGNVMNLHILGNFDLLKNYADMKVRVKITSILSNLLGPLNAINPVNLINSAASMNVVTAKAFSIFCETVTEEELAVLPSFSNSYVDSSATKFQLGVRGDVAKPFTLIKSFKWLATQMQFNAAKEFADSLPEPVEGSTATNIEEAIEEAKALEAEKKTLKYKIKHIFDKEK